MKEIIDVTNLNFSWGNNHVLKDLNLNIKENELVSIIERDSDAVYDILDVLISNLNDKQLDIMEDLIVNQYGD